MMSNLRDKLRKHPVNGVDDEGDEDNWFYIDDEDIAADLLARCLLLGCESSTLADPTNDDSIWVDKNPSPTASATTIMYREGNQADTLNEYHVWQINVARYERL